MKLTFETKSTPPSECKHEFLTRFVDLFMGKTSHMRCLNCDTAFWLYASPKGATEQDAPVFTQEDALLCRGLAKYLESGSGDAELRAAGVHSFNAAPAAALNALAAKLAALLPRSANEVR